MAEPNVIGTAIRLVEQVATKYWWVAVLVFIAWFLRWYGMATDEPISSAEPRGPQRVFTAATMMLLDVVRTVRKIGWKAAGALLTVIATLGWIFQVGPMFIYGIPAVDPVVWATTAATAVAMAAGIDDPIATPQNVLITFIVVLAGAFVLRKSIALMDTDEITESATNLSPVESAVMRVQDQGASLIGLAVAGALLGWIALNTLIAAAQSLWEWAMANGVAVGGVTGNPILAAGAIAAAAGIYLLGDRFGGMEGDDD